MKPSIITNVMYTRDNVPNNIILICHIGKCICILPDQDQDNLYSNFVLQKGCDSLRISSSYVDSCSASRVLHTAGDISADQGGGS